MVLTEQESKIDCLIGIIKAKKVFAETLKTHNYGTIGWNKQFAKLQKATYTLKGLYSLPEFGN